MGLLSSFQEKFIIAPVAKRLTEEIAKAGGTADVQQWVQPMGFNSQQFQKRKTGSAVTYDQLRSMAKFHDISRACINIRKRQITQLSWDLTTLDDSGKTKYKDQIPVIRSYFAGIGGYNTKMRKLLDKIVEDYLVIDAVTLYKRRTRDGSFLGLVPIDPTTIKILVDESGGTPLPPNPAYEQWIRGTKVAEMSADELLYDMLSPSTETPYGFSVMEALVMTVEASLRSSMYNVAFFTDGSLPEGFYELPETWSTQQIKEFQAHFDAMLSGDPRMQHKIKFMPASGGKGFQAAKEFNYEGIKPYQEWLMRITASLFGVMPNELGFTDGINKSNGEEQTEIAKRNSIKPMAHAIEEMFNEILWNERLALTDATGAVTEVIGPFPELQFKFMDLDTKDELIDSKVTEAMVKIGAISVDEWRKDKGLDPIGIGPYVLTASGPILVSQIGKASPQDPAAPPDDASTTPEEELKRWEKKAITDLKEGRPFRKFESELIDDFTKINLSHDLQRCTDRGQVKDLFAIWRKALQEGISNDAERLLKKLSQLEQD
jgi:hypothetical protein